MFHVNPDVDIFVFADNTIQVRKIDFEKVSIEILEIGGEDAADLARILPIIWSEGVSKQQFYDFFEGKYSGKQIKETIATLETAGIISREKVTGNNFGSPFRLHKIWSSLFCFRIDCFVFAIRSEDINDAQSAFHKIARRWGSESDLKIHKGLSENSLSVFPAKRIESAIFGQIKELHLDPLGNNPVINFKLLAENDKLFLEKFDPFEDASKAITDPKNYWGKFLVQAVHKSGIVANVRKMRAKNQPFRLSKKFFIATHSLTDFDGKPVDDSQIGLGEKPDEACGKAVMETLERYCCKKRPESLLKATVLKLFGGNIINPGHLACYLPEQLKQVHDLKNFQKYDEDLWTDINDKDGKSWLIPACHIWYCFNRSDFSGGKSLFWASTNGAAAHFSFDQAAFSAVRELIERDAIMIWWLNRLTPPYIKASSLSNTQKRIISKIEHCAFEVRLLNLTLDLLPIVMAVARNKNGEKPYFFCGAACHEHFPTACEKALQELEQAVWIRLDQEVIKLNPEDIDSPLDHEMFYMDPENGKKLDFFFEGSEQDAFETSMYFDSLQHLARYLEDKGFQLFLKEITCDEIIEAELGVHIVKAVIPDLIPITFGFMTETLGLRRIYDLPVALGLAQCPLDESTLFKNYQPHFFP